MDSHTRLYFEPQQAALCGVHALNTLLQGPYFNEVDLAELAAELDALERQLMLEGGADGEDFLRYAAEDSGNVAASGLFSIQVLAKALEVWGLQALPLGSPDVTDAREDPAAEAAFICNLQEHWFTIRSINGGWWNFNSMFRAPEPLSAFYLSAFLGTLQEQGYSIFVIRGQLPAEAHPDGAALPGDGGSGPGEWVSEADARRIAQESQALKQSGYMKAAAGAMLARATEGGTRMTLRSVAGGAGYTRAFSGGNEGVDDELAAAIAASLQEEGAGGSGAERAETGYGAGGGSDDDENIELAAAIAASMEQHTAADAAEPASVAPAAVEASSSLPPAPALPELGPEPEEGDGTVELALRLPDGQRRSRRFRRAEDTVGHVAAFAAACGIDVARHCLAMAFPRRVLDDFSRTLASVGVGGKEVLTVELVM
jgi:Ataxin-3